MTGGKVRGRVGILRFRGTARFVYGGMRVEGL